MIVWIKREGSCCRWAEEDTLSSTMTLKFSELVLKCFLLQEWNKIWKTGREKITLESFRLTLQQQNGGGQSFFHWVPDLLVIKIEECVCVWLCSRICVKWDGRRRGDTLRDTVIKSAPIWRAPLMTRDSDEKNLLNIYKSSLISQIKAYIQSRGLRLR